MEQRVGKAFIDGSVSLFNNLFFCGYSFCGTDLCASGCDIWSSEEIGSEHSAVIYSELMGAYLAIQAGFVKVVTDNNIVASIGSRTTLMVYEKQIIGPELELLFKKMQPFISKVEFIYVRKTIKYAHDLANSERIKNLKAHASKQR